MVDIEFLITIIEAWLANEGEFTIQVGGDWLRLADYQDVIRETYDSERDEWACDTIIDGVEFFEFDNNFVTLIQPIGACDRMVRIPLEEVQMIRNEETGEEVAWL